MSVGFEEKIEIDLTPRYRSRPSFFILSIFIEGNTREVEKTGEKKEWTGNCAAAATVKYRVGVTHTPFGRAAIVRSMRKWSSARCSQLQRQRRVIATRWI